MMDREADLFELFDQWRENPRVELLVRAKHNRRTTAGSSIDAAGLFNLTCSSRRASARCRSDSPRPLHGYV